MKTVSALLLCLCVLPAAGQSPSVPPQRVLSLGASASVEVPNDWLTVAFSTIREAPDAATVQAGLKQALDAALAEARKLARPGQVEVRAGSLAVYPRHGSKGAITGWQGSAEVVVEGGDLAGIARLAGRIGSMSIARVGYSLSREGREQVESEVAGQAIERFKARATETTRQFGFRNWSVREVAVNTDVAGAPVMPVLRERAMAAAVAEAPLPVEPGLGRVSATVSGSIQME